MKAPRLQPGDKVHVVSPASTPTAESLDATVAYLTGLGFEVELGRHVLDRWGYLAGTDRDRLADMNRALRDPKARAIIASRGGKGAYRIAAELDFDAAAASPKLLVGFSEITILQLALYRECGLASLHGAAWHGAFGAETSRSFEHAVGTSERVTIVADPTEPTSELSTSGRATGTLLGGNQDMIATAAGWQLPSLDGAILLLEDVGKRLGHVDRQLTMLERSRHLDGIVAFAVGQYADCGPDDTTQGDWTVTDVLRDRLDRFGIPILGGLPIGHGEAPRAVPVGTTATLDADAGTLRVDAAVI